MVYKKITLLVIVSISVFCMQAMKKSGENVYVFDFREQEWVECPEKKSERDFFFYLLEEFATEREEYIRYMSVPKVSPPKDKEAIDRAKRIAERKENINILKANIQRLKQSIEDLKKRRMRICRGTQLEWKKESDSWSGYSYSFSKLDEANEMGLSLFD